MVDDDMPQDSAGDESDRPAPARASGDVTLILSRIEQGEPQAAEQLLPLVYEELRKLAAAKMAQEKPDQTLQATALVHEAYIRLVDVEKAQHWDSRGHFFAAAAEAMRRILVESARARTVSKRDGGLQRVDVSMRSGVQTPGVDLIALHEALDSSGARDHRGRVGETAVFRWSDAKQAANVLGISVPTADRIGLTPNAWLLLELSDSGGDSAVS